MLGCKSGWKVPIFALLLGFVSTKSSSAELEWRGFLTTGASFTDSAVPYQQGINRKARATEETFLGLNLSKDLGADWRVAAQILARASQADSTAKVDWAFVTYEPNSNWNISLGRQKIPMWMVSAYLDVGRAYPWVVPPEEVYTLFNLKSFTGAAAAFALPIGSSTLTFRPYGGDVLIESVPNAPTRESKIRGSNMFGSSLEWVQGKSSLRLAYNRALWNLNIGPALQFSERRYEILTFGVKTDWEGFWMSAEYAATRDNDEDRYFKEADKLDAEIATTTDGTLIPALAARSALLHRRIGGSQGYYATVGKQIDAYLLHLTYAAVKRPTTPTLSRDQKSLALGLNYDLNVDSVIKLEAKRVYVPLNSQGLFDAKPTVDEAMVYRIGYSMIF
ncbi:MAG: hypothetical protein H7318_02240 [Oligoflexus sp.]|nr:hypothetical protein [Oligoflexus sp.]